MSCDSAMLLEMSGLASRFVNPVVNGAVGEEVMVVGRRIRCLGCMECGRMLENAHFAVMEDVCLKKLNLYG